MAKWVTITVRDAEQNADAGYTLYDGPAPEFNWNEAGGAIQLRLGPGRPGAGSRPSGADLAQSVVGAVKNARTKAAQPADATTG